jgi:hypothetical protein
MSLKSLGGYSSLSKVSFFTFFGVFTQFLQVRVGLCLQRTSGDSGLSLARGLFI